MAGGNNLLKLHAPSAGLVLTTSVIGNSFRHSKSVNWSNTKILNRSSGVLNYSNSENETASFNIGLYAMNNADEEVAAAVKALKSLTFPIKPGILPPPLCFLSFGNIFNEWACVVNSVGVAYPNDVWSPEGIPMVAEVSIAVIEVDVENRSASDVGSGSVYSPSFGVGR